MLVNFLNNSLLLLVFSTLFALMFANPAQSKTASCAKITCEEPDSKDKPRCEIVPEDDDSLPRPTGRNAKCCPLWKCGKRNGDYYTIHGSEGETEVVEYSKNGQSVSSLSTGNHDSVAHAGGSKLDIEDALGQIKEALKIKSFF